MSLDAFRKRVEGARESVEILVASPLDVLGHSDLFEGSESIEVRFERVAPDCAEGRNFWFPASGIREQGPKFLRVDSNLFRIVGHGHPTVAPSRGAIEGKGRSAANPDAGARRVGTEHEGLAIRLDHLVP
jgi:hypothetical protein